MVFFRKLLCVSLCASLALSSIPCYSYAYADESQEVGDGVSLVSASGDTGSSDIDSGAVVEASESSAGSSDSDTSGVEEDSGEVLSLGVSGDFQEAQKEPIEDSGRSEFAASSGELGSNVPDGDAAAGGYGYGAEAAGETGAVASEIDGGLIFSDSGIMPLSLTEAGYLDKIYFALGANSTAGSEQIVIGSYKWNAVKFTINWVVSWMLQCVVRIDNNLTYANNYLKAIDTATKYHRSEFTGAWGYGYGGTVVFNSNSPAGWLKSLYNYSATTHTFPGASGQTTEGFAEILWRISYLLYDQSGGRSVGNTLGSLLSDVRKQWGYGYGGTRVIEVNSPAYWLEWLYKYSWTTHTFVGESSTTTKGVAEILWRMDSKLWDTNRGRSVGNIVGDLLAVLTQVNDRDARSNAWGYDYGSKRNYYDDSPAGWLKYLKDWAVSSNGWGYDYGSDKGNYYQYSPAGWLEWLYKYSWTSHTFAGETAKTTKGFAEILWLIDSKLWNTNLGRSVGNLLGDVLAKLDDLTVNVKGDLIADVDLGYIEARLDTIVDLMRIGAAKDVVDAIVGDFDSTASAALVGEVQAAASNAFPFCVPALVKQIFGLVQSDPSPPVLDFEVGGQSLHIDCAPMQGFANVLGWACRFLFLFVLVVSTRKFVYTGVAS